MSQVGQDGAPVERALEVESVICSAIAARRQIYFSFDGAAVVLSPHLAWVDEGGAAFVVGIQTSTSDPKGVNGPQTYPIAGLTGVRVLGTPFAKDPAIGMLDRAGRILCRVA